MTSWITWHSGHFEPIKSLFDSKEIVSTITSKSLPFFIYAVQKFPLTSAEKQELQDLKKLLPLAAILFVKVESDQEDYSSLHGREKVCCHHMLHQVHQNQMIRSRIGQGSTDRQRFLNFSWSRSGPRFSNSCWS